MGFQYFAGAAFRALTVRKDGPSLYGVCDPLLDPPGASLWRILADRDDTMVTFSRPTIESFESTGCREYRPPGLGAVITFSTTGPCGVNCTRFE